MTSIPLILSVLISYESVSPSISLGGFSNLGYTTRFYGPSICGGLELGINERNSVFTSASLQLVNMVVPELSVKVGYNHYFYIDKYFLSPGLGANMRYIVLPYSSGDGHGVLHILMFGYFLSAKLGAQLSERLSMFANIFLPIELASESFPVENYFSPEILFGIAHKF